MDIQKIDLFHMIFGLSLIFNIVFVWYIRAILKKLFFISDNIDTISEINIDFAQHIEMLNELDRFYGEPAIEELLKHSKHVVEQMKVFDDILIDLEFLEAKSDEEVESHEAERSAL
jgi:hypothetical protein